MSNDLKHVNINSFKFNQEVFDLKLSNAIYAFKSSPAAIETIEAPISVAVPMIVEYTKKGRVLSEFRKPQMANGYLLISFEKEGLEAQLQEIEPQVKVEYLAELDDEKNRNIQLLAEQLFQQGQKKEAQAEEKKLVAQQEKALKEAQAYFAQLNEVSV